MTSYGNREPDYVVARIPLAAADLDAATVARIRELHAEGLRPVAIDERLFAEFRPVPVDVVGEVLAA